MKWFRKKQTLCQPDEPGDSVTGSESDAGLNPDKARFDHVLSLAASLPSAARYNLLRALIRPIQSDYLLAVAAEGQDARPAMNENHFFFQSLFDYISFEQLSHQKLMTEEYPLSLAADMVLPWPWSMNSYKGSLSIGSWQGNPWRYDNCNHHVELWLPWRIGFVKGGNHSLAAGILAGEGTLLPDRVFDMHDLLRRVSTDGTSWFADGREIDRVRDWRTAAFYELGRLVS
ncbi:DUF6710 family protein [Pantoea agglomerans]|uniref:DUF6710 family protein n=1 Tax=Enterobacter agglomerans TaxID=549 RepID=UPI0025435865|nr:DUF6710 family protein [Pantoea agglomerans]MDK4219029.1 hypothetical protein [Pantoea agglomerans]